MLVLGIDFSIIVLFLTQAHQTSVSLLHCLAWRAISHPPSKSFRCIIYQEKMPRRREAMGTSWILFSLLCLASLLGDVEAGKASCKDPYYGNCYGIPHVCPPACPRLCDVDCQLCKPYCACDRPGAVCQDPRFIGGDGVMFYFHGKKDRDFCLVSDSNIHVNAHFIGKRSSKGRDFTWVQSIGILFGTHQLYLGVKQAAKWDQSIDNMLIQLNGNLIEIEAREGETWSSTEIGLKMKRHTRANELTIEVEGLFRIAARAVPITEEESRVHGYDIDDNDCFAHLELNFNFNSLGPQVNGVLGQTYSPSYRSRVKMGTAMPIMGGAEKFASSNILATDCAVSSFKSTEEAKPGQPLSLTCGGAFGGAEGMVFVFLFSAMLTSSPITRCFSLPRSSMHNCHDSHYDQRY